MIEIGIGVLFAFIFVTAYLLVSKLLSKGDDGHSRWRELKDQTIKSSKRVKGKPAQLFLPTREMREHHSKTVKSDK